MRHNPYLKSRSTFLPLLMRGSHQNSAIGNITTLKDLFEPRGKSSYSIEGISFETVKTPKINNRLQPLPNIEMCSTQCTQELFEKIMGFNPSYFKEKLDSSKRPVEVISWFDCIAFCNKLSNELKLPEYYKLADIKYQRKSIERASVSILGGNGFRLPTADEWELFAKADTGNTWSGTSKEAELGDYAWYWENSNGETHPVAQKKPNEWGMYDMSGNVSEWCWDKYDPKATSPSARRVNRGGSLTADDLGLRSAYRYDDSPGSRSGLLGFRFCRSLD